MIVVPPAGDASGCQLHYRSPDKNIRDFADTGVSGTLAVCGTTSMDTPASTVLSPEDQIQLDRIARELDDPAISSERLIEMLAEVTEIAGRYQCDYRFSDN